MTCGSQGSCSVSVSSTVSGTDPSLPYDRSRCDSECPLCEKQYIGKGSRKSLAKHVKDKHQPNPDHPRFKVWLEASARSWCVVCASSFTGGL